MQGPPDPLDALLPPLHECSIRRGVVVFNRLSKRRFTVSRLYKPLHEDDSPFTEPMWILVLWGAEDEVLVSERSLHDEKYYRLTDNEDDSDPFETRHKVHISASVARLNRVDFREIGYD